MANNFFAIDIAKIACFCVVVTALFAQQVERFVALEVADLTAIAFGAENRTTFRDCKGSNSSRRGWLVILGGVIPGAQRSPLRKKMLPFGCGVPQYSPTGTWQEKCDWNTRQPSRQVPEDLPSGVFSRARGTAISIGPKVPVSDRVRLPWRWPAMPVLRSLAGGRQAQCRARRGSSLR